MQDLLIEILEEPKPEDSKLVLGKGPVDLQVSRLVPVQELVGLEDSRLVPAQELVGLGGSRAAASF